MDELGERATARIIIDDLPLYRVRVTSGAPGYRLVEFGRKLFSARNWAECFAVGDLRCAVESYDRHTGQTVRVLGEFSESV